MKARFAMPESAQPTCTERLNRECGDLLKECKVLQQYLEESYSHAALCEACRPYWHFFHAVALGELGGDRLQHELVLQELRDAIEMPASPISLRVRAQCYLASRYGLPGEYTEAERLYQEALQWARENELYEEEFRARYGLALLYNNKLARHSRALEELEALLLLFESGKADRFFPPNQVRERIIDFRNEQAVAYLRSRPKQLECAAKNLTWVYQMCKEMELTECQRICEVNLGVLAFHREQWEEARQWLRSALISLEDKEPCAEALYYLGEIALRQQDLTKAHACFEELRQYTDPEKQNLRHFAVLAHLGRARLAKRSGRIQDALQEYRVALHQVELLRSRQPIAEVRIDFQEEWKALYLEAMACAITAGDSELAFSIFESGRSRTLYEQINAPYADVRELATEIEQHRLHVLEQEYARSCEEWYLADETHQATVQPRMAAVEAQLGELHRQLALKYAPSAALPAPSVTEIQAHLGTGALVLVYAFDDEQQLHVFGLDQRGVRHAHLRPVTGVLRRAIHLAGKPPEGLMTALGHPIPRSSWREHLHKVLLAPIDAWLQGVETVYIVPDPQLRAVPFHLLAPSERGVGTLTEGGIKVRYLPGASVLTRLSSPAGGSDVLMLGTNRGGLTLPAAHVHYLAAAYGGRVLSTLEELPAEPGPVGQLYIVSHNHSGGGGASQGLLINEVVTPDRLRRLPLGGARVVLAACSSAGGDTRGNDWAGPAAALFHAGAAQVVGSLWPVSQAATVLMMDYFWPVLLAGADPADALHQAAQAVSQLRSDDIRRHFTAYQLTTPEQASLERELEKLEEIAGSVLKSDRILDHPFYYGSFVVLGC